MFSPAYDTSIKPWPFNPAQARQLLEEEGWIDTDGDGIRDKLVNGKREPFRFKLYYYVKSLTTKVIAEYIATALREVGIDSQISESISLISHANLMTKALMQFLWDGLLAHLPKIHDNCGIHRR